MTWAFMTDPTTGNIALYNEPTASGAYDNPNSARNAPLNNPNANMSRLIWHILYDNMEVYDERTVSVSHPTIAAASSTAGSNDNTGNEGSTGQTLGAGFSYDYTPVDYTLYNHALGYEPVVYLAIGSVMLTPGHIIQIDGVGGARYVSPWVDTNNVYLREFASRSGTAMTGFSQSYRLLTIRRQRAADGNSPPRLLDVNQVTGLITMGDGRWRNDRRYLQVVPGGSPYGLNISKNMDANNGAPRTVSANGTIYDPVPSTLQINQFIGGGATTGPYNLATPGNYGGSFTSITSIQVQAP